MRLFKKEPIITFSCEERLKGAIPEPIPASQAMPRWYRKTRTYVEGSSVGTLKQCVPFADAMTMGYIIPLWVELKVNNDGSSIFFNYRSNDVIKTGLFDKHLVEQLGSCPIKDSKYGGQPLKFINPWLITTPPGWSCMFIQPINHFDDKLHIITGVVDTDRYKSYVHFPFLWLDNTFDGFMEQGTPLVQVIPFKRTAWTSEVGVISETLDKDKEMVDTKISTIIRNAYRLNWWAPKRYK